MVFFLAFEREPFRDLGAHFLEDTFPDFAAAVVTRLVVLDLPFGQVAAVVGGFLRWAWCFLADLVESGGIVSGRVFEG